MVFMTGHTVLYTVGYHGRTHEDFFTLLKKFDIEILADIRGTAYSRIPGYSQAPLRTATEEHGLVYVHIETLGVPQVIRDEWKGTKNREVFRERYTAHLASHRNALHGLSSSLREKTYCLMCVERDPRSCHRHITTEALNRLSANRLTICNL